MGIDYGFCALVVVCCRGEVITGTALAVAD